MSPAALPFDQPPLSLFVSLTVNEGVLTARPTGPTLGQREAPIVAEDINAAIDAVAARLRLFVLDLSDIQMMPSFGLGMCIELRNRLHKCGVATVLYGLSDELEALFRMLKVDRLYIMPRTRGELARAIAA